MKRVCFLLAFTTLCCLEVFASDNEKDLWITAETNKTVVYEQEPVLLSYKVYSLVDIIQLSADMPDLKGFLISETDRNDKGKYINEKKDGRGYRTAIWNQYVLYPQTTGKLAIPNITFNGTVVKEKHSDDPIQDFFDGNDGFEETDVTYTASGTSIDVKPLPEKPEKFSGGVGSFSISATIDKANVNVGEPFTIHVIVKGVGNFKSITAPSVNLSSDFEKYDTKTTDSLVVSEKGYEGTRTYEVVAEPLNDGKYSIPAVEFIYFDLSDKTYKTIKTDVLGLTVSKTTTEEKTTDIDDIDTDKSSNGITSFFAAYWLFFICSGLLVFFVVIGISRYKKRKKEKEIKKDRDEMAARKAKERLQKADQLILEGKNEEFYDEVLRMLWGYLSDKMKIPSMDLSSEKIKERLSKNAVDDHTISLLVSAIDECEYERYKPGDAAGNMRKTYDSAYRAIIEIERTLVENAKAKR